LVVDQRNGLSKEFGSQVDNFIQISRRIQDTEQFFVPPVVADIGILHDIEHR
jgi:hypothetical protein